jgi:hypothetical protein
MRKLISATMTGVFLAGMGIGVAGCSDEASEKKETVIKSPGGTSTTTETTSVKQSGQNPPSPKTP